MDRGARGQDDTRRSWLGSVLAHGSDEGYGSALEAAVGAAAADVAGA